MIQTFQLGECVVLRFIGISMVLPQQTRYINPMLVQCWSTVYDAGPTLYQHWVDVSCLLWKHHRYSVVLPSKRSKRQNNYVRILGQHRRQGTTVCDVRSCFCRDFVSIYKPPVKQLMSHNNNLTDSVNKLPLFNCYLNRRNTYFYPVTSQG